MRVRLWRVSSSKGLVDPDGHLLEEALSQVADARSSSNEVEEELLVLVVEALVDAPEALNLLVLSLLTVDVDRLLLEQVELVIKVLELLRLSENHDVVPVQVLSEVVHVAKSVGDTLLHVLGLLSSFANQLVEKGGLEVSKVL